jgi:hypothetical protein
MARCREDRSFVPGSTIASPQATTGCGNKWVTAVHSSLLTWQLDPAKSPAAGGKMQQDAASGFD